MFKDIDNLGHESVVFHHDKSTNLKTIVGIHDTTLGPALGGVRIWDYENEEQAINDVLRLSKGMTFKAAYSGIDCGGGKSVIIGDVKKIKTEALLRSYGRFIESLGGCYITAPDVNTDIYDLALVSKETKHAAGLPAFCGGSDDPSEFTAYGVLMGIKAAIKHVFDSDSICGRKILVEGVGKVGKYLVSYLSKEGAEIYVTDISKKAIEDVSKNFKVKVVKPNDIYDLDLDVYSPCALGAILNDSTIKKLKCKIVAGGANNQLEIPEKHDLMLKKKNILYAPDFVVNTGGLLNVYNEYIGNYNRKTTFALVERVYDRCLKLFKKSQDLNISTNELAESICLERISSIRKAGLSYSKVCI
ncbi:MAG: Glu/Leu/Phe/Val dehydrogenase [Bacteroidetes bacterium]|nr:Glu/Leu/Phe/Val dehydrogenase [Bacteroidota bacterium]